MGTDTMAILRWYILVTFSFLSGLQCLVWFTFSSVKLDVFEDWFHIADAKKDVDLLLNWGPIMYFPTSLLALWLLELPGRGLKYSVKMGALLTFLGSTIRAIPFLLKWRNGHFSTLIFLHIGQICNAMSGPFVLGPPTKIAQVWFPSKMFGTATAIAAVSNGFGNVIGFLLGPWLVSLSGLPLLIYVEAILGIVAFIPIALYYPNHPSEPPDKEPSLDYSYNTLRDSGRRINRSTEPDLPAGFAEDVKEPNWKIVLGGVIQIVTDPSCMAIILVGGNLPGFFAAWNGLLQQLLGDDIGFSQSWVGWIGFALSCGATVGSFAIGPFVDRFFPGRYKCPTLAALLLTLLACVVFVLMLPTFMWDSPPIQVSEAVYVVVYAIGGFFQGALTPLFYVYSAKLSEPLSPGISSNLLMFMFNLGTFILLAIAPSIGTDYITIVLTLVVALTLVTCLFVRGG